MLPFPEAPPPGRARSLTQPPGDATGYSKRGGDRASGSGDAQEEKESQSGRGRLRVTPSGLECAECSQPTRACAARRPDTKTHRARLTCAAPCATGSKCLAPLRTSPTLVFVPCRRTCSSLRVRCTVPRVRLSSQSGRVSPLFAHVLRSLCLRQWRWHSVTRSWMMRPCCETTCAQHSRSLPRRLDGSWSEVGGQALQESVVRWWRLWVRILRWFLLDVHPVGSSPVRVDDCWASACVTGVACRRACVTDVSGGVEGVSVSHLLHTFIHV